MSNDPRYTAQDGLNWEAYHDATMGFITGENGHPGAPPPGYKESYMLRHPKAPLPSNFPKVEAAWANRHASAPVAAQHETADVNLSTSAFSTLLHHQALRTHQFGEIAKTRFRALQPRAVGRFAGPYNAKATFFGRNGGPVATKGWKHAQVAKSVGKGKGKKKYFKGKRARVRFAALKAETAEAVDVAGPSGATEVVHNLSDGLQTVAPGDVFMADYVVKDEEEDAGGSLFTDEEDASAAA
ncbi:hypothetical protein DFH09DRAFT_1365065 [Mycena vulgaris]|nr:hypothetical protein DFH09DRAFT_1365065 [Mycena vulgaris]